MALCIADLGSGCCPPTALVLFFGKPYMSLNHLIGGSASSARPEFGLITCAVRGITSFEVNSSHDDSSVNPSA